MSAPADCPGMERWQALLSAALPPDQCEPCERHLESCPVCQERLDRAMEGDALVRLAQGVGDPTTVPADAALSQILERLHETKSPLRAEEEPADLYFLRPADRPGVLGLLGNYEVQEVIGVGGMGIVLKAFDPALHRLVAIKVLAASLAGSPTARRRFTREAQAAAAVCHDHVVAVHGVHEADGLPYLVMQYVAGESLQARLDRTGPLEVVEIVRIALQTASGLAAAHAQGLIHRDIKPANLLLENGLARVKITDFGLARTADDVRLTRCGEVAGTPEYMAPEQARGEPVDHRADLFSLGSVLYAMCTGVPPFRGSTAVAVLRRVSDEPPAPIRSLNPDAPAWLEAIVARLMAKDPAERFQSAAEVGALLEGCLAHLREPATAPLPGLPPSSGGCPKPSEPIWKTLRIRYPRRLLCLAAALLLAALGLSGYFLLPHGRAPNGAEDAQLASGPVFYQDFRGGRRPVAPLSLFGAQVDAVTRAEEEGFRITLPSRRDSTDPVGLVMTAPVQGDFEITARYQILHVDRPMTGYGVGFELYIMTDTPKEEAIGFSDVLRPVGGEVYWCSRNSAGHNAVQHHESDVLSSSALSPSTALRATGRLRLTRVGAEVAMTVAENDADAFRVIFHTTLGLEDLSMIRLAANTGAAQAALDLRIVDLMIRCDRPPASSAPALRAPDLPTPVGRLHGHTGPVHNVLFTPDGRLVSASGWPSGDRSIRIWDPATFKELKHISTPGQVQALDLSADGRFALAGLSTGAVLYVDLQTCQVVKTLSGHGNVVSWVGFARDGLHAFSTSCDGTARMWDLGNGQEVQRFQRPDRKPVIQVDEQDNPPAPDDTASPPDKKSIICGAVSPDGSRLLTGDTQGILHLWNVATGEEVKRIVLGRGWIHSAAFMPDGRQAVVADREVGMYDLETGEEVRVFPSPPSSDVQQAALSPDGRRLLTGGWDGVVRLYNVQSGNLLRQLGRHDEFVFSAAFSANGRLAASAGGGVGSPPHDFLPGTDFDIRIWDLTDSPNSPPTAP